MIMSKKEIEFSQRWAANAEQPLNRDAQIFLMMTSQQRHQDYINRIMKSLEKKGKDDDLLG